MPFGGGGDVWVEWVIRLQVRSGSAALAHKPASGFAAGISDDARAVAASLAERIVIRSRFKTVFPGIVCNGLSRWRAKDAVVLEVNRKDVVLAEWSNDRFLVSVLFLSSCIRQSYRRYPLACPAR